MDAREYNARITEMVQIFVGRLVNVGHISQKTVDLLTQDIVDCIDGYLQVEPRPKDKR